MFVNIEEKDCQCVSLVCVGVASLVLSNPRIPPTQLDFLTALGKAHSSVGANELEEYVKWTKEFGQDG